MQVRYLRKLYFLDSIRSVVIMELIIDALQLTSFIFKSILYSSRHHIKHVVNRSKWNIHSHEVAWSDLLLLYIHQIVSLCGCCCSTAAIKFPAKCNCYSHRELRVWVCVCVGPRFNNIHVIIPGKSCMSSYSLFAFVSNGVRHGLLASIFLYSCCSPSFL